MAIMENILEPSEGSSNNEIADKGISPYILNSSIIVGFSLIAISIYIQFSAVNSNHVVGLLLCSGLAIILAAFGSRVQIRYRTWSAAGAAAGVIILFFSFMHFSQIKIGREGQISFKSHIIGSIELQDDVYERQDAVSETYTFFVKEGKLNENNKLTTIILNPISVRTAGNSNDNNRRRAIVLRGETSKINKSYFSEPGGINWTISDDATEIIDTLSGKIVFSEKIKRNINPSDIENYINIRQKNSNSSYDFDELTTLVPKAFAQEQENISDLQWDYNVVVKLLISDDTAERRTARQLLTAAGPLALRPMYDAWLAVSAADEYRIKLGVCFSSAAWLRHNPARATEMSQGLKDEDIALLIKSIGDDDPLVRECATEALYILKDIRTVEALQTAALTPDDADLAYNAVVALVGVSQKLDQQHRDGIVATLLSGIPTEATETRALIQQIRQFP